MEFEQFISKVQDNFREMTEDATHLFEVDLDKTALWNLYLDSFPEGTNKVYRERREYDCNHCRQFIKSIGNVVTINNNKVTTIWDFETNDSTFQPVIDALSSYVKSKYVSEVWLSKFRNIGIKSDFEQLENGKVRTWNHLFLELPSKFADQSSRSLGDIKGGFRDIRNVFKRSLDEITEESISVVLELISQNSLYRGLEWKEVLTTFLKYKQNYELLNTENEKDLYAWENSIKAGAVIGKIRNHSMGTLLVNISEGIELDIAVKKYEAIVAPSNYKRTTAIATKRQIESAKIEFEESGYMESLPRRFATLNDITVNNILFCNRDSAKRIAGSNVFDDMIKESAISPKKFSKVEEISIDSFISDILPNTQEVEVMLENRHANNLMSLITSENTDSKTMFKWDNNFGWAYSGNIADSNIRENVKSAGGKVDGDLRFSIQWNEDGKDNSDLDAHCKEADGFEIYYSSARKPSYSPTKGQLDVDIVSPNGKVAVENITWPNRATMKAGTYKFFVHMFSGSLKNGFRAEIEFDGTIYSFDCSRMIKHRENVMVAEVTLGTDGKFTIKESLSSGSSISSKEIWGVNTNQFIPVSVISLSPNYWDGRGVGNKHYFFMLKDCINPENPNSMFNEYLKEDLRKHRLALEMLGAKMSVKDSPDQLSGLGFSSTKRNDLIVKVKGKSERVLKIKF